MLGALRNQQCMCGSGNKYKHCCYEKDNAKRLGTSYKANSWNQRRIDKERRQEASKRERDFFRNPLRKWL